MQKREELKRHLRDMIKGKSMCRGPAGMRPGRNASVCLDLERDQDLENDRKKRFVEALGGRVIDARHMGGVSRTPTCITNDF